MSAGGQAVCESIRPTDGGWKGVRRMANSANRMFGGGLPPIPRATRILIAAFVGLSILNAVLAVWARVVNLGEWFAFSGGRVLSGELWRLVTYPLIETSPIGLVLGALVLAMFAGRLEAQWGTRPFATRAAILTVVPALIVSLLAIAVPPMRRVELLGLSSLFITLIVAFASSLGNREILLFPIPFMLRGDQILWLEGAFLGLLVLFSGSVLAYFVQIVAFGFALAWFRFDLFRGVRRRWLLSRRKRLESQLRKLKARRSGLRVVENDDDEPRGRYLN